MTAREPRRLTDGATPVILGAVVVGLLIMGDSFLYSALPLSAASLQLSLFQVSLLLSANRWIRLVSNSVVARLQTRVPMRTLFWGASCLGLLSTAVFIRPYGFVLWLIGRLIWGLAWSVFRQSAYVLVWHRRASTHGTSLGLWWGLVRMGSGLGVLIGGWLLDAFGFGQGMLGLTGLAVVGLALNPFLSWPESTASQPNAASRKQPFGWATWKSAKSISPVLRWLLSLAAGIRLCLTLTVAITSLYLQSRLEGNPGGMELGVWAGIVLATHWMSQIGASVITGALSDRLGRMRTVLMLAGLTVGALAVTALARGYLALVVSMGLMLLFSGLRIAVEVAVSDASRQAEESLTVMGLYATLDDFASALGPILGLTWFRPAAIEPLFFGSALTLMFLVWGYARRAGRETPMARP